jgi:hypothetical protein
LESTIGRAGNDRRQRSDVGLRTIHAMRCLALLVPLGAPACTAHTPATQPAGAAGTGAHRNTWSALTWEERHSEMTFRVLPNMGRLFQQRARKPAPDLTCRSCHGADAEQVAYAMPHGLTALDPRHMPDPRDERVRFMTDEVTPKMADMLGVDRADFTCFGCHPAANEAP